MDPYTIEQLEGPRQEAEEIIALARINEPGAENRLLALLQSALNYEWHRGRHVGRNEHQPVYA